MKRVQREVELQRADFPLIGKWGGGGGGWVLVWDVVTRGCNESDKKCKQKEKKTVYIHHHAGLKHYYRGSFRNLP